MFIHNIISNWVLYLTVAKLYLCFVLQRGPRPHAGEGAAGAGADVLGGGAGGGRSGTSVRRAHQGEYHTVLHAGKGDLKCLENAGNSVEGKRNYSLETFRVLIGFPQKDNETFKICPSSTDYHRRFMAHFEE